MSFHRRVDNPAYPFVARESLRRDLEKGLLEDDAGTRVLEIEEGGLLEIFLTHCGDASSARADRVLRDAAAGDGERFALRILDELARHYGVEVEDLSMSRFFTGLQRAFERCGLGRVEVDLDDAEAGVLVLRVRDWQRALPRAQRGAFGEAFFGACFTRICEAPLAARATGGDDAAIDFVVSGAERIRAHVGDGDNTEDALDALGVRDEAHVGTGGQR